MFIYSRQRLWAIFPALMVCFAGHAAGDGPGAAKPPAAAGARVRTFLAIGTIQPEETVEIHSAMGGKVIKLAVDFNSAVQKGAMLAQIDDSTFLRQLAQAKANLDRSRATLALKEAELALQQRVLQRARALAKEGVAADTIDVEELRTAVTRSALDAARAEVIVCEAAIDRAKVDLEQTRVVAPIDGIVLDRVVTEGQAVAVGTRMFLIAGDLRRMMVSISVNEKDIPKIRIGQAVNCKVAAFPDMNFQGKVTRVRLNAVQTQNAVAYAVEASIDNKAGKLLPYMTAEAMIDLGEVEEGRK